jgi:glycogen operon protein
MVLILINAFDGGVGFAVPDGQWNVAFSSDSDLPVGHLVEHTMIAPPRCFVILVAT